MADVIVSIRGGVAEIEVLAPNIEVEVHDYDVAERPPDDDDYVISLPEDEDAVSDEEETAAVFEDDDGEWYSQYTVNTFTDDFVKHYLKTKGVRCPYCESTDLRGLGDYHSDDDALYQSVTCHSCNNKWKDVYKIAAIIREY